MTENDKIVILGGGLCGLSIALNLSKMNHSVKVLEKNTQIGGLSKSIYKNGYIFDLGPHYVHTHKKEILNFLFGTLKDGLIKVKVMVSIFFNKKFVDYPLKGLSAVMALSPVQMVLAILNLILARCMMFIRDPKNDNSFKDWIVNRFGRVLYNIYFGPYAKKAWQVDPEKISAYVARKRVQIISLSDYARKLIKRSPKNFHAEDPLFVGFYYPKKGVGQIVNLIENEIINNGAKIDLGADVSEISIQNNRVDSIKYVKDGKEKTERVDFLFSTIPLLSLLDKVRPAPTVEIINAVKSLNYSSIRILYLQFKGGYILDKSILYYQDPNVKFNRIYDIKRFSPDCVPEGYNGICVEFTCSKGDEIWNACEDDLVNYVMNILVKDVGVNLVDLVGHFSEKIDYAYPKFEIGFQEKLNKIFSYLESLENLVTLGRQGLFCYANMDEVLDMGFKSASIYNSYKNTRIDYSTMFEEYVSFLV